ncbi:MAG: ABC transporter permease [Salinivirgaceae bacterium]|nr:ABC transporter permease [Salinivirgaceae bacterium]
MKSNILTIIKKEFNRVFYDRQLLFTTVILPGLIIYFVYSLMGDAANKMAQSDREENVAVQVENLPQSVAEAFKTLGDNVSVTEGAFTKPEIDALNDKSVNRLLVRFPVQFDSLVNVYEPAQGLLAPNVEIYYNSTNTATQRIYSMVCGALNNYENSISNRFDINRADSKEMRFNQADDEKVSGMILSKILPILILMMLFSGVMPIAQTSIAGEKERGTIATLLITPMRREELALGKILAISGIALLSALSSFIGIVLSMPKLIAANGGGELSFSYSTTDMAILLLVIISSVFIMTAAISLLSTLAKDVRNAGTLALPVMFGILFVCLISMFQNSVSNSLLYDIIPFYNSVTVLTALFQHELHLMNAAVCIAANIAYTLVSVWVLTKMFNNEKVMFSK